jgi:hypothetical protein
MSAPRMAKAIVGYVDMQRGYSGPEPALAGISTTRIFIFGNGALSELLTRGVLR